MSVSNFCNFEYFVAANSPASFDIEITDIKRPAYDETPLCSVGKIVRARAFLASVCCWFPSIQLMHNMKLVEEAQFRYKFPVFFVDKGSKKQATFS